MKALRIQTVTGAPFRRAGRGFDAEPVEISLDDLTESEVTALTEEPNLVTEFVAAEDDTGDTGQDLSQLTVTQLRARASELGVSLGDAKRKDEIIDLLKKHHEQAAAASDDQAGEAATA